MSKLADAAVQHTVAAYLHRLVRDEFAGNGTRAAEALGIPQSQLSAAMNPGKTGRSLGLVALIRVADYAGISLDELIGRRVPPRGGVEQEPASGPRDANRDGPDRVHQNLG